MAKLDKFAGSIEKNTLETSEQNRLLVIQDQLRRMEMAQDARSRLRGQGDFLLGNSFETAIGRVFESFQLSSGQLGEAKAGREKVVGLRALERMGFNFENTNIGKDFKNKIMQEAFRAQAPLGLSALGMGAKDIKEIKESGFNQETA